MIIFPNYITLESLMTWGIIIKNKIAGNTGLTLLIDTNSHNLESVECLKWLRNFLTKEIAVSQAIDKVAFIQPVIYRAPGIMSQREAYFSDINSAKKWLKMT